MNHGWGFAQGRRIRGRRVREAETVIADASAVAARTNIRPTPAFRWPPFQRAWSSFTEAVSGRNRRRRRGCRADGAENVEDRPASSMFRFPPFPSVAVAGTELLHEDQITRYIPAGYLRILGRAKTFPAQPTGRPETQNAPYCFTVLPRDQRSRPVTCWPDRTVAAGHAKLAWPVVTGLSPLSFREREREKREARAGPKLGGPAHHQFPLSLSSPLSFLYSPFLPLISPPPQSALCVLASSSPPRGSLPPFLSLPLPLI